ncbi:MAG: hypothetical protein WCJ80_06920 [Bacteroidota bacterium]
MNNSSGKSIPRADVIFNSVDKGRAKINSQKRSSVLFTQKSKAKGNSNQRKGIDSIK